MVVVLGKGEAESFRLTYLLPSLKREKGRGHDFALAVELSLLMNSVGSIFWTV